ncbi:DUF2080 family transposase-associated protein [Bacillus thuringiensis]|nr:DUF2080 family transposase-associated protein [Bacillus thuringiensis]
MILIKVVKEIGNTGMHFYIPKRNYNMYKKV